MSDGVEAPTSSALEPGAVEAQPHPARGARSRLRAGVRRRHNWVQLAKFCAVGSSGYLVNLAVFAVAVEGLGLHHLLGATLAFAVAVTNNFWWNRQWTFGARSGRKRFQAARFLTVSLAAFVVAAVLLELLVSSVGVPELAAQAISLGAATPLNFVGNKMWSFGRRTEG